jgi:hypothetical protein
VSPRSYQARDPRGGALRVEVNLTKRVLVLYRDNKIALISHVSAGGGYYYCSPNGCRYAITSAGRFRTMVYMPGWVTVPLGKMYNPVFFIGTAFAIHGDTLRAGPPGVPRLRAHPDGHRGLLPHDGEDPLHSGVHLQVMRQLRGQAA